MKSKMVKRILTCAFSAVLLIGMSASSLGTITAQADDPDESTNSTPGTVVSTTRDHDTTSEAASIAKILTFAEGESIPANLEFTFKIEPINVNGDAYDGSNMPTIGTEAQTDNDNATTKYGTKSISFTGGKYDTKTDDVLDYTVTDGKKSVVRETGDILGDVIFNHAGIYTYKVTEKTPESITVAGGTATITSSQAEYYMSVYVEANPDGDGFIVEQIITQQTKDDGGNDTAEDSGKVDATPGGTDESQTDSNPTDEEDGNAEATGEGTMHSGMAFTNDYALVPTDTLPNEDGTNHGLYVETVVSGDYADASRYFDYTLNITPGASATGSTTYYAYVMNAADDNTWEMVTDLTDNAADENSTHETHTLTDDDGATIYDGEAFSITSTDREQATLQFKLKADQRLVITAIDAGATFSVTQAATTGYTPSAVVSVGDSETQNIDNLSLGDELTTTDAVAQSGINSVVITNYAPTDVNTGILLNNLPYILLLVVAVGMIVIYAFAKSFRRED